MINIPEKIKSLPKFWKIYIFAVTVFILIVLLFFAVLIILLNNYEAHAAQDRSERAYQAEVSKQLEEEEAARRELDKINAEELACAEAIEKRDKLLSVLSGADKAAAEYVRVSAEATPDKATASLLEALSSGGASVIADSLVCKTGKYETESSVIKYLDSLPGTYSFEPVSGLEYKLKKGGFTASAVFKPGPEDENGHKTYTLDTVIADVPTSTFKITVPEGAVLKANGVQVTEAPKIKEQDFADGIPSSFRLPGAAEYELEGCVYEPLFDVTLDGKPCPRRDKGSRIVFSRPVSDVNAFGIAERLQTACYKYSARIADQITLDELNKYLYKNTKFYDAIQNLSVKWYYYCDRLENVNYTVTDFTVWSDRLVSAHVVYDQMIYWNGRLNADMVIDLVVFMGTNDAGADKNSWLIVNID